MLCFYSEMDKAPFFCAYLQAFNCFVLACEVYEKLFLLRLPKSL